jgi:hypothetical protein
MVYTMSSTKAASGQVVHRELAGWLEKSETHTAAIECVQGRTPVLDHQDGGLAGRHDCSDNSRDRQGALVVLILSPHFGSFN